LDILRRELRRRKRQAVFIALGLALRIGLVITVTSAATGVQKAQAAVLHPAPRSTTTSCRTRGTGR
jgi:hypothetical protein